MKVINSLFLLLFVVTFMSCGGSTSAEVVDEASKNATSVVKEVKEKTEAATTAVVEKNKSNDKPAELVERKRGSEYNAKYICTDHCKDSGSAGPGKCRTCKKDYIKNVNYVKPVGK